MSPSFPPNYEADSRSTHAEVLSQQFLLLTRRPSGADEENGRLIQFRGMIRRAPMYASLRIATFPHHVLHVFELGSQEEMVRSNTCRRIAFVQDMQSCRRAVTELIRQPMSQSTGTIEVHQAITGLVSTSHPKPAITAEIYSIPETSNPRCARSRREQGFNKGLHAQSGKTGDSLEACCFDMQIVAGRC
jgi:hypothetical protein